MSSIELNFDRLKLKETDGVATVSKDAVKKALPKDIDPAIFDQVDEIRTQVATHVTESAMAMSEKKGEDVTVAPFSLLGTTDCSVDVVDNKPLVMIGFKSAIQDVVSKQVEEALED